MDSVRDRIEAEEIKADREALDSVNRILSSPTWNVGMLEDICGIVRGTGRSEVATDED